MRTVYNSLTKQETIGCLMSIILAASILVGLIISTVVLEPKHRKVCDTGLIYHETRYFLGTKEYTLDLTANPVYCELLPQVEVD